MKRKLLLLLILLALAYVFVVTSGCTSKVNSNLDTMVRESCKYGSIQTQILYTNESIIRAVDLEMTNEICNELVNQVRNEMEK